ncbi:hypothetical protein M3Y98_01150900 [Aphelenchoides besseyi]|nr:hypothetical protein M3Y98_01150900 [Aphelenchoides besseyi]
MTENSKSNNYGVLAGKLKPMLTSVYISVVQFNNIMADIEMSASEGQNGAAASKVDTTDEPMEEQTQNGEAAPTAGEAKEEESAEGTTKVISEELKTETPDETNEIYQLCIQKKMSEDIAKEVVDVFNSLNLNNDDFDERAIEQLASFPIDQAKYILKELKESKMYGVQNKPQYLMSVMRNLKDRQRQLGIQQAMTLPLIPGPPIEKISEIIEKTKYQLEVTVGQRKYHAPPNYTGPDPSTHGHEIYIGQIPRDVYEDQLIPLFETIGPIFDLRLMMDPIYGRNRGYAFLLYCEKDHAAEAAKKYDGHEIQSGKQLKVNVSVANRRLFLGNIPKSKSKEEILEELKKHPAVWGANNNNQQKLEGVIDVIIYSSPDAAENRKNRGFCFVDFQDHKAASDAKRRLQNGKVRPWNGDLVVDWAEQQEEPDEETMSQVKVIYVKNLKESVTDDQLTELFSPYGEIDRVKKIRDYAFVHYKDRDSAVKAIEALKGTKIDDVEVEVSLAKPQADKKKMPIKRGMPMDKHMGGGGQMYGNRNGAPRNNRGNSYNSPSSYGKSYGNYPPAPAYGYDQTPAGYGYSAYPQAPPYYPPMDPYAYAAPDPYFAGQNAYGPPGGYSTSGYGAARGGYGGRGGMNSSGYKRGGMGGGIGMGGRGSKRRGDSLGGPASKRGGRGM